MKENKDRGQRRAERQSWQHRCPGFGGKLRPSLVPDVLSTGSVIHLFLVVQEPNIPIVAQSVCSWVFSPCKPKNPDSLSEGHCIPFANPASVPNPTKKKENSEMSLCFKSSEILSFLSFLSRLHGQRGAWTHDPEVKRHMLSRLSQAGTPCIFFLGSPK